MNAGPAATTIARCQVGLCENEIFLSSGSTSSEGSSPTILTRPPSGIHEIRYSVPLWTRETILGPKPSEKVMTPTPKSRAMRKCPSSWMKTSAPSRTTKAIT